MILAGIVLYNPEEDRLDKNVNAIIGQVDKILLVDNGSENYKVILKKYRYNSKIEIIHNKDNEGVAYALNQILNYAQKNLYEWFITLDQDSVCEKDIIEKYKKYINLKDVGMITCEIIDRNIKSNKKKQKEEIVEVDRCITSGSFNNTRILYRVGGFDNKMFIDYVDFDICQVLKENGYKIYKTDHIGLLHEVGKGKLLRIFGKEIYLYNHNPVRVYYYVRNAIYYIKKHKRKSNAMKEFSSLIKRILLILIFEKNKILNIKAIIKGVKEGIVMKVEADFYE